MKTEKKYIVGVISIILILTGIMFLVLEISKQVSEKPKVEKVIPSVAIDIRIYTKDSCEWVILYQEHGGHFRPVTFQHHPDCHNINHKKSKR